MKKTKNIGKKKGSRKSKNIQKSNKKTRKIMRGGWGKGIKPSGSSSAPHFGKQMGSPTGSPLKAFSLSSPQKIVQTSQLSSKLKAMININPKLAGIPAPIKAILNPLRNKPTTEQAPNPQKFKQIQSILQTLHERANRQ